MEEFPGVEGVVDKEQTADWSEGYTIVDFPEPDEESYLHVLFKKNDDSRDTASISPMGVLAE